MGSSKAMCTNNYPSIEVCIDTDHFRKIKFNDGIRDRSLLLTQAEYDKALELIEDQDSWGIEDFIYSIN